MAIYWKKRYQITNTLSINAIRDNRAVGMPSFGEIALIGVDTFTMLLRCGEAEVHDLQKMLAEFGALLARTGATDEEIVELFEDLSYDNGKVLTPERLAKEANSWLA